MTAYTTSLVICWATSAQTPNPATAKAIPATPPAAAASRPRIAITRISIRRRRIASGITTLARISTSGARARQTGTSSGRLLYAAQSGVSAANAPPSRTAPPSVVQNATS
jgi:hypothetical protein